LAETYLEKFETNKVAQPTSSGFISSYCTLQNLATIFMTYILAYSVEFNVCTKNQIVTIK